MPSLFVSIVGTQVMGTLHPRNAFLRSCPGGRTILLPTSATQEHARRLQAWIRQNDGGSVAIHTIPMHVGGDDCAAAVVTRLAREAQAGGERIFFNLDGGLNYLIADCVMALGGYAPVFIQSSEMRSLAMDAETGRVFSLPSPETLSVASILDVQGVEWRQASSACAIADWCAQQDIPLPEGCMKNVEIGGITFDLAWNPGSNRINFLKDFRWLPNDSKTRLEQERDLTHWASDRKRGAQMFDRSVHALVHDKKTAHRLVSESCGKIRVCPGEAEFGERAPIRNALKKLFARKAVHKDAPEELKVPALAREAALEDNTLIVSVGSNIVPTLMALCSHAPRHAVLCCTKALEGRAQRIRQLKELWGLESVRIVSVAVEGSYLERLLPPPAEGARVSINITPGTKGQGAMLAWWGRRHDCSVWSIDNRSGQCFPLFAPHGEKPVPAIPCPMESRFLVEGVALRSACGLAPDERPLFRTLLAFMRAALDEGKDARVMRGHVSAGGMRLVPGQDKTWHLEGNGETFSFSIRGGEWLEKLAASALEEAGFSDVRYRVRFSWPEDIEKAIRQNPQHDIPEDRDVFSQDLDVAGSRHNEIVVISCKADPNSPVEKAAVEVASTGERFGRFALRVLLHLGQKESMMYKNNVMIIGWRQLCRTKELFSIIQKLHASLRTTEE